MIVGIDLGTTNSAISIIKNGRCEVICDEYGNRTIPSVVSYTNSDIYIGLDAKKQINLNPEHSFYETKRFIGKKYSDYGVQKDIEFCSYNISTNKDDNIVFKTSLETRKEYYTPEEIASNILIKLKTMAEDNLDCTIDKAVITVPSYFNDSQRQATKDALTIAGMQCMRIINEPTAAALAYGLGKATNDMQSEKTVLVYDLGGGTLDCSILKISNGIFEVLSSTGNTRLGGLDFDKKLYDYCKYKFKKNNNIDKLDNIKVVSLQKLKMECERAKKVLSVDKNCIIRVDDFYDSKNLIVKMDIDLFNKLCSDLFILCLKPVIDSIESAEINKNDINEIVLVGGATRMTNIKENLNLYFNGVRINDNVNPDEVVVHGAAIQGHILSGNDEFFSDSVLLLDIVPLSLGVETIGGEMNVIIPRGKKMPITRSKIYTTDTAYATSVNIEVYEGERKMTSDNFKVGEFELTGIKEAQRGIPTIKVTFSIDMNGIISVTALDCDNNENKKTIIVKCNKGRLSRDKINELVEEAKKQQKKDRLKRDKRRLHFKIKEFCDNINENIKTTKLSDNDVQFIEEDIKNIKEWLSNNNINNRTKEDYKTVYDNIKNKYISLIHDKPNKQSQIKGIDDTNITATTIFQTDEETNKNSNDYVFINGKNNTEHNKKLLEKRDELIILCNDICNILNIIEDKDVSKLKSYIDDTLLWVYVKDNIKLDEYIDRIDTINTYSNDISLDLDNKINKKEQIEQLCYILSDLIDNNENILNNEDIHTLKNIIVNTMDWMNSTRIEDEYDLKLEELNSICNNIYENISELHISTNSSSLNGTSLNKLNNNK